nr:uncharacterized protein LOC111417090 [Onthophagus taurus]
MDKKINENAQNEVVCKNIDEEKVVLSSSCGIKTVQEINGESNLIITAENENKPIDIENTPNVSATNSSLIAKKAITDLEKIKNNFNLELSIFELELEAVNNSCNNLQVSVKEFGQHLFEIELNLSQAFIMLPKVFRDLKEQYENICVRLKEVVEMQNWFNNEIRQFKLKIKIDQEETEMLKEIEK